MRDIIVHAVVAAVILYFNCNGPVIFISVFFPPLMYYSLLDYRGPACELRLWCILSRGWRNI